MNTSKFFSKNKILIIFEKSDDLKSLWESNCVMPEYGQLKKDIKTDVLIIGGGAAGLLTAYFLDKSGVNYILVEKGRICGGVTKNTTAKITF